MSEATGKTPAGKRVEKASARTALGPSLVWTLGREMGLGWLSYRVLYALQHRSGWIERRHRATSWNEAFGQISSGSDLDARGDFFATVNDELSGAVRCFPNPTNVADKVLEGTWPYFGLSLMDVGFPPNWHKNPSNGHIADCSRHWSRIGDCEYGDIKYIWEASRFSVVFALARAYAATGAERYAKAFWTLLESWIENNPPQQGPNWKCGQEAAIRAMAWCFGLHVFEQSPHTTNDRRRKLALALGVHALRIEKNLAYAVSQRNNHAISEAVGLWTIGLLFPGLRHAERWRDTGRGILEREAARQIADDGSYVQHSTNYHRVMLHDFTWALRLGQVNRQPLPGAISDRVGSAVRFLAAYVDPDTGRAPNYGSNDGANFLPWNACEYSDYRPVLQAAHYAISGEHLYKPGPWDEDLLWLFGPKALERDEKKTAHSPKPSETTSSGYCVLRGFSSLCSVRSARFRNRPAHADQLHVDLWWRGLNIARDAGTFLYNGEGCWQNGLSGTGVHNTVTVDGQDQMLRVGRFLWAGWAQGTNPEYKKISAEIECWQSEHGGYRRLGVTHRRAVIRHRDTWFVVDDVLGAGNHSASVQWLLADLPYEFGGEAGITLTTPAGLFGVKLWGSRESEFNIVRAGDQVHPALAPAGANPVRGWYSPSYGVKEPALSIALECRGALPLRFISVLSPELLTSEFTRTSVLLNSGDAKLALTLQEPGNPILAEVKVVI